MSKSSKPAIDWRFGKADAARTKSWQALPYALLGTILFAWGSSADLNPYVSGYIVLLVAQLGTVVIYLLINRARKHQNRQDR